MTGQCESCGQIGQVCCDMFTCDEGTCDGMNRCACGKLNQPCCNGTMCAEGTCNGTVCTCGGPGEACCPSAPACMASYTCRNMTCTFCGYPGYPCCGTSCNVGFCSAGNCYDYQDMTPGGDDFSTDDMMSSQDFSPPLGDGAI
jgi:hypothetical protein